MRFATSLALSLLFLMLTTAGSQAQTTVLRSVGFPQTGPNNLCSDETWSLNGVPSGPESSGAFLGVLNSAPGATEAITLQFGNCAGPLQDHSLVLASTYDDAFGTARGWTAPNVALENLTLRDIPVAAGNGVLAPIPLPGGVPPNPLPPTITEPTDPITIGTWLQADGNLEITCNDSDGTAFVAAAMHDLVPNGVYTTWGHWADLLGVLSTVPFGGLPNVIVADAEGDAEFCRELAYCPLVLTPDGSELQFLSLMYMAAGGLTFGVVPYEAFTTSAIVGIESLPFRSTTPGGIVSFDQLGFRINATGGPDPGAQFPAMCVGPAPTVPSLSATTSVLIGVLMATGIVAASHLYVPRDDPSAA